MSKDIRSFFTTVNKKPSQTASASHTKKRPAVISDSSDEEVPATPNEKSKTMKKRKIASNGSETDKSPKVKKEGSAKKDTKSSPSKLKPISALEMFKSSPKQSENSKKEKKSKKQEMEEDIFSKDDAFSDEDFKATLLQVDNEFDKIEKNNQKSMNINHNSKEGNVKSSKIKSENGYNDDKTKSPKINSKNDSEDIKIKSPKKESRDENIKSPKTKFKKENDSKKLNGSKLDSLGASSDDQKYSSTNDDSICDTSQDIISKTPKSRKRKTDLDETITDEERYERRRQSSALYQKYLHRAGPANPGSKEVPKGTPNCLKGLVFLITGVLESLERDEAASIITDLGGRVVKAISGKVTHLVAGDDAGPAKLDKAKSMGIKIFSEDDLLEFIRERSSDSTKSNLDSKETKDTKSKKIKTSEETSKDTKRKVSPMKSKEVEDKKPLASTSSSKKKLIELPKEKLTKTSPVKANEGEEVSEFFKKDKLKIKEQNVEKPESRETEKVVPKSEPIISENVSWVDKYKPKTIKQIIGQQGENSNVKKLIKWMENWYKNRNPNLKLTKPSPWAKNDDGAYFKAALLSGPPGVGKTTTANLVSRELGFDVVELNASDTRSKNLLREDVGNLLSNKSLAGYFNGSEKGMTKKHVLLMDEVDGMAGNEDRGGMQELIQLIKNSSIPIICMCNDRNHPKIRSLVNYCFDLKFSKPRVEQIRGAMLSVCYKENIKIKPEVLDQIISGTQNDIRQTLNNLSMWVDDNISLETAKDKANNSKKDIKLGPWDVVRKVFSEEEQKKTNIHQKSSLFFHDYSIAPLFVQENYLSVVPHCDKKEWLDRFTETAEYLSLSDLADSRIRKNGAWSLLPLQAIYTSVAPGHLLAGHFGGQINFPSWLGKNSKRNKFLRMLSELQIHMRLSTSGSLQAVNLDYLPYIKNSLIKPLQNGNVEEAIQVMQNYHLLREDLENIVELSLWPKQKDPLALINGKVKAAFTRQFNKECQLVSSAAIKKRGNIPLDQENEYDEENEDKINSEDENEDDDITKDSTIKAKKVVKPEKGDPVSKKKKSADTIEKTKKPRVSKKK